MNRFERAVDILVEAYHNRTLERRKCSRCAVGNILGNSYWSLLFATGDSGSEWYEEEYWDDPETAIRVVGVGPAYGTMAEEILIESIYESEYSIKELAMIEQRFEKTGRETGSNLKALYSIVELMASWEDLNINIEQVKDRFVLA